MKHKKLGNNTNNGLKTEDERNLILMLRDGNLTAYEELWARHSRAAMTLAKQLVPSNPEDQVSESFTAVLHTITVSGKGPVDGFRAYLFTSGSDNSSPPEKI